MLLLEMDYILFNFINDFAGRIPWIDEVMKFFAEDAEYLFYFSIVVYWFTRRTENKRMVVQACLSAFMALGVSVMIAQFFYRDRPFVSNQVNQLIEHAANASFPSDHAIGAFVIASSFWIFRKREGLIWLILAFFIAFSRVWTGVHYPIDVVSGVCIGIGSTAIVHFLFTRFNRISQWYSTGIAYYERLEQRVWPKSS